MRPTINDVAREAGLSRGTVDRVINNKANVSEKSEKKVRDAIKKLGYIKSPVASALAKRGRPIKIGIIYPDVEKEFWKEVERGIKSVGDNLQSFGVEIVIRTTDSYDYMEQIKAFDFMVNESVSGIVTMSYHQNKADKKIEELENLNIPVITFISDSHDSKRLCHIGPDDYKSGIMAAKLMGLYLKGKGNIVVIGVHRVLSCMEERIKGFEKKINSEYPSINILNISYTLEKSNEKEEIYRESVAQLTVETIKKYPEIDGIYATNSLIGCIGNTIKELGLVRNINLVGHENTEEIRGLVLENIIQATVYQNQYAEIIRAVNLLYKYIIEGKIDGSLTGYSERKILIKEKIE